MALAHTIGNKVEAAYHRGDLFPAPYGRLGTMLRTAQTSADVVAIRS